MKKNPNGYDWTDDISEELADEIKESYADSMKKWNNVYFYEYNSNATTITKNKLINVEEGTEENHNLSIYPAVLLLRYAETEPMGNGEIIGTNITAHTHYAEWLMRVNVVRFYPHDELDETQVNHIRERTGAHELGHILGLRDLDVDNVCTAGTSLDHHHEALMGYGDPLTDRSVNITYKDIAGVAITRGLHTDADHVWLYVGIESDLTFKLVCTICNGVGRVDNLDLYTYEYYGSCGYNHELSSGNMMAVACYGTKDYYKCKYCRYVAPFENNVEQNYIAGEYIDALQHSCYNNVAGLNYYTYEPHAYQYTYVDNSTHSAICACGDEGILSHWVRPTSERYANCVDCGALIDLGGTITPVNPFNITKVSVNGSYILPNGVAVIADADIEAYLNGTLVFYDPDDLPVTQ